MSQRLLRGDGDISGWIIAGGIKMQSRDSPGLHFLLQLRLFVREAVAALTAQFGTERLIKISPLVVMDDRAFSDSLMLFAASSRKSCRPRGRPHRKRVAVPVMSPPLPGRPLPVVSITLPSGKKTKHTADELCSRRLVRSLKPHNCVVS